MAKTTSDLTLELVWAPLRENFVCHLAYARCTYLQLLPCSPSRYALQAVTFLCRSYSCFKSLNLCVAQYNVTPIDPNVPHCKRAEIACSYQHEDSRISALRSCNIACQNVAKDPYSCATGVGDAKQLPCILWSHILHHTITTKC